MIPDLVMPLHNLLDYSSNYCETTGTLWIYCKDEETDVKNNIAKTLKIHRKHLENTEADGANRILKNAAIAVQLKYLSNFWKSLEIPLINCKWNWNLNEQSIVF